MAGSHQRSQVHKRQPRKGSSLPAEAEALRSLFPSVGTSGGDAWLGYLLIVDGYLFALIPVLRPVSSDRCLPVLNHHKRLMMRL